MRTGADIACGEGQPLGIPLSSGGPYFGFMVCRAALVRQMPGRIVGRTVDVDGRPGFTLTLQAREQHIRRSKATSNICTNQGLMVTAATIYMSLMGAEGLRRSGAQCHANTRALVAALTGLPGVGVAFEPYFHEAVLLFDQPVAPLLAALSAQGILGGYDLGADYPELGKALLVCATEMRTAADIACYAQALSRLLRPRGTPGPRGRVHEDRSLSYSNTPGRVAARRRMHRRSRRASQTCRRTRCAREPPLLPEVSELQAVRHYTRLSQLNFSIDTHFYPLGSCTMKYNPRAANRLAMLPGFLGRHPLGPVEHGQGFLACMYELQEMLQGGHRHGGRLADAHGRCPGRVCRRGHDPRLSSRARRPGAERDHRARCRPRHQSGHSHDVRL